jgi:hypothetical protein
MYTKHEDFEEERYMLLHMTSPEFALELHSQ